MFLNRTTKRNERKTYPSSPIPSISRGAPTKKITKRTLGNILKWNNKKK
jgi:hypothetical protein